MRRQFWTPRGGRRVILHCGGIGSQPLELALPRRLALLGELGNGRGPIAFDLALEGFLGDGGDAQGLLRLVA